MTQDQRWQIRFDEVINFMEKEYRKPQIIIVIVSCQLRNPNSEINLKTPQTK